MTSKTISPDSAFRGQLSNLLREGVFQRGLGDVSDNSEGDFAAVNGLSGTVRVSENCGALPLKHLFGF